MTNPKQHTRLQSAPIDLVVCSSSGRWTSALRVAMIGAIAKWPQLVIRLREVEDFRQLDAAVREEACAVVGVEVGEENLRPFLAWAANRHSVVPVVGMLSTPPTPWEEYAAQQHRERCSTFASLVREAGAAWTLGSPLEAMDLLEIAARHGQNTANQPAAARSLESAIWRSLPWQSNRAPLRLVGGERSEVRGQRPEVSR